MPGPGIAIAMKLQDGFDGNISGCRFQIHDTWRMISSKDPAILSESFRILPLLSCQREAM